MRLTTLYWGLTLLFGMTSIMVWAQPVGLHTESKKAAKPKENRLIPPNKIAVSQSDTRFSMALSSYIWYITVS